MYNTILFVKPLIILVTDLDGNTNIECFNENQGLKTFFQKRYKNKIKGPKHNTWTTLHYTARNNHTVL